MAELNFPNIAGNFQSGYAFGAKMREEKKAQEDQAQLRNLAPQVISGDPTALSQAAAINPEAAGQYDKVASTIMQRGAGAAEYMLDAVKRGNPREIEGRYQAVLPFLTKLGAQQGKVPPPQFDPAMIPAMEQLVAMRAQGGPQGRVQSTYIDAAGNRVAIMADGTTQVLGQNAPNTQIIDSGNGFYGVNKGSLQAAPVMIGGQQQAPQPQSGTRQIGEFQATSHNDATGESLPLDQIPPDEQAAAIQAILSGQTVNLPPRQGFGGQLRSAPKPQAPTEFERRMQAAQSMGATPDELKRMVIGREGAAAGAKPMPAAALRMVTDANSALKEVGTVNNTLSRIRQEIASDALNLGPIRNRVNEARIAAGVGNEESTKYSTLMTSLRGLQNAALRLNKGVQTEGDAQRIWQELLGNLNDEQAVLANIDRLMELNQRAQELHEMNLETVNQNYGRTSEQPSAAPVSSDIDSLLEKYR